MKKLTIITIIISILVLSLFSGASAGFSQINVNSVTTTDVNVINTNPSISTPVNNVQNNFADVSETKIDTTINLDLNDKKEDTDNNKDATASKTNKITTVNSGKIRMTDFNKKPVLIDVPIDVDWSDQDNTPKPNDSGAPEIEAFNYEKPANPTTAGGVEIKPYYPIESDVLKCTVEKKSSGFKFVWKVNDKIVSSGSSSLQNKFKDNDVVVCEAYAPASFGDQYLGRGMVKVVNSPIRLDSYSPKEGNINLYKNESKRFAISVTDKDNENINFVWYVDNKIAKSSASKSIGEYTFTSNKTGKHVVEVKAYDGSMFSKKSLITIKWNVEIIDKEPSFKLIINPNPVLEGNNVTFSLTNLQPGTANDPIRKIEWDFGDKSHITEGYGNTTKVHSYSKQGTYNMKVVVTDMDSSVIKYATIVVNDAQPSGIINASSTNILEGQNVTFGINGLANGSSADTIKAIYWDFGDGKTGNGLVSVSHQYMNQGKYKASLRIVDEDSEKSSSVFIYVNDTSPVINALFVSNTPVNEGSNITFGFMLGTAPTPGSTIETIKKYEWDFGDNSGIVTTNGNTSTINHTYIDNGTYDISLKVWDSDSFTNVTTQAIINDVNPSGEINTNTTRILFVFYYADVGELLNFSISGLANGSATDVVKSIEWSMGNGANFTTDSFIYAYPLNGTYNVTLRITDEDSFVENFIVINVNDVNPSGDFEFENKTYYEGDIATFNAVNISSGASEDPVTNITWDFGDGENGTGNIVQHIYKDNATYSATMTIYDSNSMVSVSHDIIINDVNPKGNISLSRNNVSKLENVHFSINGLANGSATDVVRNIEWSVVGNDFSLSKINATEFDYNFSDDQSYNVVLRIDDEDSFIIDNAVITVNDVQPAGVINSLDEVNEGDAVGFGINGFVNNSNDPVTSIIWDFGDGAVNDTAGLSVSHIYDENGSYFVVLTITDSDSVFSSNKTITIDDVNPFGIAAVNATDVFEGDLVGFNINGLANGSATDVISAISWNADDGFNSISQSFSHAFNSQGTYNVTLDITDEDSTYRANNLTITVKDTQPELTALNIPLTGVEGVPVNFASSVVQTHDPITLILWDFGDGITASGENAAHTYLQNGNYNVSLTVSDSDSSFSVNGTININDTIPTADFVFAPLNPNPSDIVTFNSTVSGYDTPLSYLWDFGDGSAVDNNQNTTHNYTADGYYIINFKVTDADGSAVSVAKNITIGNDTGRLINSYLDLIYYSDNSTLTINGLDYSFIRDSNLTRPVNIISSQVNSSVLADVNATSSNIIGSNLARCTVTNSFIKGVFATDCNFVNSFIDPPVPLNLTGTSTFGTTSNSVNITNSSVTYSLVTDSNITNSIIVNSTFTNSVIANSTFSDAVVSNANITNNEICDGTVVAYGQTYTATSCVNYYAVINVPPVAAFIADTYNTYTGVIINFDASGSSDPNGDSLTYSWNFGDSSTAAGVLASHSYTTAGSYIVTLNVTDSFGLNSLTTQTVTVSTPSAPSSGSSSGGGGGGSSGKIYEIKENFTEKKFTNLKAGDEIAIKIDNFWYRIKILGLGSVMDFRFSPWDVKYYLNKTAQVNLTLNDAKNLGVKYDKWDGSYGTVVLNLYDRKAVSTKTVTTIAKDNEPTTETEGTTGTESGVDVKFGEKGKAVEVSEQSWYDKLSLDISKKKLIGTGISAGIVVVGMLGYFGAVALFGGNKIDVPEVESNGINKRKGRRKKK